MAALKIELKALRFGGPSSMTGVDFDPGGEFVMRPAVRAGGFTRFADVEVHLGVAVPQCHIGRWAGAVHAAIGIQISGLEFDNSFRHDRLGFLLTKAYEMRYTKVSQWAYFWLRPLTISKNAACIFSVIGPRLP